MPEKVYTATKEALEKIKFKIPKNKTVLIKPNVMAANRPEQHSITHYCVVDAVCRLLKENNCRIQIGESIAFYEKGLTMKAFASSRIKDVAAKYGAELIAFDGEPLVKITKNLKGVRELYLPRRLLEADAVINVPKLKTHGGLRLSGALKNMFGCLPGGYKQKMHIRTKNDFELSDVFLDIHAAVKPALNIMDAIVALDGGPSAAGKPKIAGAVLASTSAAALDSIACRIIGYEPEEIATLVRAKARGFIRDFDAVEVIGTLPSITFKSVNKKPIPLSKKKEGMFVLDTFVNPRIIQSKCTRCGECRGYCAPQAISFEKGNYPEIDLGKCINCYYCIGECTEKAIGVRRSFMNRFISVSRAVLGI